MTEIVTVNGRPFASLLDSGYQNSIRKELNTLEENKCGFNMSNKNLHEVKQNVARTAEKIREKIRSETENRAVSLLADVVTKHRRSILGVSLQYSFNGDLKVRSIGFIELEKSHTGKYLAQLIIKRLGELGVALKQVLTITTDNGKNILKMIRDMTDELIKVIDQANTNTVEQTNANPVISIQKDILHDDVAIDKEINELLAQSIDITDEEALERCFEEVSSLDNTTLLREIVKEVSTYGNIVWDITAVNCAVHTLQLGVGDGLKKLRVSIKNVIELVRLVAKFLRLKSTCIEMEELGKTYSLPNLECTTRWGSMYLMVCFFN